MSATQLLENFEANHREFVSYINSLTDEQFVLSANGKWAPGQQLDHVYKCNQPLAFLFANKPVIESKFGKIDRPTWSNEEVFEKYTTALAAGGKAPTRFIPEEVTVAQKQELAAKTLNDVSSIVKLLNTYTEEELDSLAIPHPLLGNMSIREMMYLMTYHATHHLNRTRENLGVVVGWERILD